MDRRVPGVLLANRRAGGKHSMPVDLFGPRIVRGGFSTSSFSRVCGTTQSASGNLSAVPEPSRFQPLCRQTTIPSCMVDRLVKLGWSRSGKGGERRVPIAQKMSTMSVAFKEDACHGRERRLRNVKGVAKWLVQVLRGGVRMLKLVAECKWIIGCSAHRAVRPNEKTASGAGVYRTRALIGNPLDSSSPRSSRQPVPLNNFNRAASRDFLSLIKIISPGTTCPGASSSYGTPRPAPPC